jgi:hypothetical protein
MFNKRWAALFLSDFMLVRECHAPSAESACGARARDRAARFGQVKKGPLAETSPMLNDISGVPSWEKVCGLHAISCEAFQGMHLPACRSKTRPAAKSPSACALFEITSRQRLRWGT